MDIVAKRMGPEFRIRFDLIGSCSILADDAGEMRAATAPRGLEDIRLRAAGKHERLAEIERLLREVYSLWLCGPAGGGGVRMAKRQRLSNVACLVPRELVPATCQFVS